MHGGHAEAAERLGVPGVGAGRIGDDDVSHAVLRSGLGQRGDDAAEVGDGGGLGPVGVAVGDRADEVGELAETDLRPPRPQRQLELVAHQLGLQPVDQTCCHRLSGDVPHQFVQPLDEGRVLEEITGRERAAQACDWAPRRSAWAA